MPRIEPIPWEELKPKQRQTLRDLLTDFARWASLIDTKPQGELAEMSRAQAIAVAEPFKAQVISGVARRGHGTVSAKVRAM